MSLFQIFGFKNETGMGSGRLKIGAPFFEIGFGLDVAGLFIGADEVVAGEEAVGDGVTGRGGPAGFGAGSFRATCGAGASESRKR